MTELLGILNDQVEALQNLYKQDVERGNYERSVYKSFTNRTFR